MTGEPDSLEDWAKGWFCLRAKPRMEAVAAVTLATLDSVEVFFVSHDPTEEGSPHFNQALISWLFICSF